MAATIVLRASSFAFLWWLLAEGRTDGWGLGGVAIVAATWASLVLWPPAAGGPRLAAVPGFLAAFLVNSVRGGWQVAWMALRGRGALDPAVIEVPLDLPEGAPRVLLAGVLALMPGSTSVELAADRIRVHVLDRRQPVVEEAKAMERRIARLFGARA